MNMSGTKTTQVTECRGLRARIDIRPGSTRLALDGEIDLAAGPMLRAALDRALEQPVPLVVIDVNNVEFCDCSGVGELARAARTTRGLGIRLLLVGADEQLRRLIELTEAHELLDAAVGRHATRPAAARRRGSAQACP